MSSFIPVYYPINDTGVILLSLIWVFRSDFTLRLSYFLLHHPEFLPGQWSFLKFHCVFFVAGAVVFSQRSKGWRFHRPCEFVRTVTTTCNMSEVLRTAAETDLYLQLHIYSLLQNPVFSLTVTLVTTCTVTHCQTVTGGNVSLFTTLGVKLSEGGGAYRWKDWNTKGKKSLTDWSKIPLNIQRLTEQRESVFHSETEKLVHIVKTYRTILTIEETNRTKNKVNEENK